jgi:16S rRNA A1518/A1519 N6-dimethyltransferase RsmA/KsgA/DIM1 with predicted DNA glycosylase/AP lyase activity
VLTQLACRVEKVRPVPASAFRPQPRVESSFVSFVRRVAPGDDAAPGAAEAGTAGAPGPAEYAAVSHLVRLAFGQRRKTLVNSLGGVGHAGATLGRDDVRAALVALALGESARPEELTPPQWRTFAAELGRVAAGGPAA